MVLLLLTSDCVPPVTLLAWGRSHQAFSAREPNEGIGGGTWWRSALSYTK